MAQMSCKSQYLIHLTVYELVSVSFRCEDASIHSREAFILWQAHCFARRIEGFEASPFGDSQPIRFPTLSADVRQFER